VLQTEIAELRDELLELRDVKDGLRDMKDELRDMKDELRDVRDELRDVRDGLRDVKESNTELRDELLGLKASLSKTPITVNLRQLIESGRNILVAKYMDRYKTINDPDYFEGKKSYVGKQFVLITRPTVWSHFVEFIEQEGDEPDKSASFLECLKGGTGSDYHDFSWNIHYGEEKDIEAAVILYGKESYNDLFAFVYNRQPQVA
jgi:regulator of replication initiation timing